MKVYLVEDAENLRQQIGELLVRIEGAEVVGVAATPNEAIAGVAALRPDVVVLDLGLRGGAGQDVLRALRSAQMGAKVVVFSNSVDQVTVRRCLELGAMAVLDKSHHFDQLYELVRSLARAES
ncbi:MAG: response regulator transcription factor [Bryobacterales bacterium]|nr:response regulator transcription factor [Bryobacterales bacterium]